MKATRICSFPDCGRQHSCKGLCASHYEQQRLRGRLTPLRRLTPAGTPFWERVNIVEDADSCWEWTAGTRGRDGRGCISINGRTESAPRVAWMLTNGPIDEGLFVCHKCDNPPCVRPDHLFLGTPGDNARDMSSKGRHSGWTGERPHGEKHPAATISDAQVIELRELRSLGWKQADLADRYGISQSSVSRITLGQQRRNP